MLFQSILTAAVATAASAISINKNALQTAYKLSIESNEDPSVNGQHVQITPAKEGAGVYTATVGPQAEESPFWLNGTILYTQDANQTLYAQLDQPVETFAALTFNNAGYEGEAEFYKVENGKLLFKVNKTYMEWFVCGAKKYIAMYPVNAPQAGCKGINITAVPAMQ